ncbi:MAG: hypothetical protein ACJAQ7_001951 [Sediminicola sp.]
MEKRQEYVKPIDQSVLFIVHDHVLIIKGKYDKINEPIIKKTLPYYYKKNTGKKDQGDPIGGVYKS